MCARIAAAALTLGFCPFLFAADYDEELWDNPLKANNNWSYYDTDVPDPHDVAMVWLAAGGMGNSGYVRAPLNVLDSANSDEAFWPAYLYRDLGDNQEIDLTIPYAVIKAYASDVSMLVPMNLQGGRLHFFIGQWLPGMSPGPEDDTWSYFYNLTPVTINDHGWSAESNITVGNDSDWGTIASNDPTVSPSDLFYHPEQWGFVIFPASGALSGELALDSFRIVSEPSVPTTSAWELALMVLVIVATGSVVLRRSGCVGSY